MAHPHSGGTFLIPHDFKVSSNGVWGCWSDRKYRGLWVVIVVNPLSTKRGLLEPNTCVYVLTLIWTSIETAQRVLQQLLLLAELLYKIIALWQMLSFPRIVSLRLMRGNSCSSINTSGLD